MGLSLLLSTPLLGVGEGQRGDDGSLSTMMTLSNDLARLLINLFPLDVSELFANNLAMSCSMDKGRTAPRGKRLFLVDKKKQQAKHH